MAALYWIRELPIICKENNLSHGLPIASSLSSQLELILVSSQFGWDTHTNFLLPHLSSQFQEDHFGGLYMHGRNIFHSIGQY